MTKATVYFKTGTSRNFYLCSRIEYFASFVVVCYQENNRREPMSKVTFPSADIDHIDEVEHDDGGRW